MGLFGAGLASHLRKRHPLRGEAEINIFPVGAIFGSSAGAIVQELQTDGSELITASAERRESWNISWPACPKPGKSAETSSKYWDEQVLGKLSDRSEEVLSRFVTKMQRVDGKTPEFQDRRLRSARSRLCSNNVVDSDRPRIRVEFNRQPRLFFSNRNPRSGNSRANASTS
jgi:hypothetical protein